MRFISIQFLFVSGAVRAKAAAVYSLLMDDARLESERTLARANQGKFKVFSSLAT